MNSERVIIIGDVHGCLEELDELLAYLEYRGRGSCDRLVFAGDLVDRGPDPVGVVRRVRELQADCVMGNHEEKHIRWARWNRRVAAGEVERNPMRFSEARAAEHEKLSEEDLAWMEALPAVIRPQSELIVVHAGLEADGTPPEEQDPDTVCRVRFVDQDGKMAVNKENIFRPPEDGVPWWERWQGGASVVYGHNVLSMTPDYHEHITPDGYACYGIDTGCVFGGWLTAVVFGPEDRHVWETYSVKAKREYYRFRGPLPPSRA